MEHFGVMMCNGVPDVPQMSPVPQLPLCVPVWRPHVLQSGDVWTTAEPPSPCQHRERRKERAEKWTCLYHSHSLFSVTEDCLETKSSVRHLAYPPNRMNYHMCVLFLLNFTSYANVNLLNAIFFFIPNSHGFMGKERLNKQTKKAWDHDCTTFVDPGFPWRDPAFLILYFKCAYYFNCSCLVC